MTRFQSFALRWFLVFPAALLVTAVALLGVVPFGAAIALGCRSTLPLRDAVAITMDPLVLFFAKEA